MGIAVRPTEIVWQPIPRSSQAFALDSRAQHTFYTGARGPGKTDTQLMRFRRNVGRGYGAFWRGIILDREYKDLDDLIAKSKRWFNAFGDGARYLSSGKDTKWIWPTGEELLFRAAKDINDYWAFHGQEFPFVGFNELTKYPTGELYEAMRSVNRSSYTPEKDGHINGYIERGTFVPVGPDGKVPPPIPLEFFSTGNPWGPGHAWVKRRFIDPGPYGQIITKEIDAFNPRTQQREKIKLTQVAIFGSYRENPYLDPIYVASLEQITDPNKRLAWLAGSWDIVAGGAIDDLWSQPIHVLPRFKVPSNWRVNRAFDWGSTHPFSVGWFTESNGEEVEIENKDGTTYKRSFPKGTIIQIAEWYGSHDIGTNTGIRMSATDIAKGIKLREKSLKGEQDDVGGFTKWVGGDIYGGPADNQIRDVVQVDEETTETKMAKLDVHWQHSNKNPGSREIGLQLLRDRLEASVRREGPGFYVMENCRATIALLPTLPRDEKKPDDIDTESEDHVWDMIRYRLLSGTRKLATSLKTIWANSGG